MSKGVKKNYSSGPRIYQKDWQFLRFTMIALPFPFRLASQHTKAPWILGVFLVCFGPIEVLNGQESLQSWNRHTIDSSLRGADGVKLADINGDNLLDIVTGWEESGRTKVYLNPGVADVYSAWPSVDIGSTPSCEDAAWIDLNGDGQMDVLCSCEGKEQSLRMFIASKKQWLDSASWQAEILPQSRGVTRWMFAIPFDTPTSDPGVPNIVVGSKNPNGMVAILRTQGQFDFQKWQLQKLASASWIMSLVATDINNDGLLDVLYTDRKSPKSGVYWLRQPDDERNQSTQLWKRQLIGAEGEEVMFIALPKESSTTTNDKPLLEFFVGAKPNQVFHFQRESTDRSHWKETRMQLEMGETTGNMKGLAVADLDNDGKQELVVSCESANAPKVGVIVFDKNSESQKWQSKPISGPEGIKFDLIELVDLDLDGDLDVLTCEERESGIGLGVIWYENPLE